MGVIIFGRLPDVYSSDFVPSNSTTQLQIGSGYGTLLPLESSLGDGVSPDSIDANDYWGDYGWVYTTWK